ncbi:Na+/H+ antiporter [Aquabacter sp. CN5-332]|uniref:Na+/H+ antiporter n=1 Tax=Aquabacter sp. CN5-332 TaxID=3156608 RepID=UPI0032B4594F
METVSIVLVILLAVVVSSALARALPIPVPLPLIQIGLGVMITAVADLGITLNPDVFFLLFLPPLLFLDGWRIPRDALVRDIGTISALAIGLVVFTVLGLGFFVHWMIPAMPLAVAFALAAIVSPTDAFAVSAIVARGPIPERIMRILEGESLLNDASGLVCMSFAVLAVTTGAFSLADAFGDFLWVSIGGVMTGIFVTWAAAVAKNFVARRFGDEPGTQILVSILMPFAAYMLAEHLGCSGVLGAVAAGLAMTTVEHGGQIAPVSRISRKVVWDAIQFTATGIIFVLLGEQLPQIAMRAARVVLEAHQRDVGWLLLYVVAITLALAVLRFLWVWVTLRFTLSWRKSRRRPEGGPSWRLIAAMSLAGVRGAVTLAGILTLPLVLPDGSPFPARDLAIFLAAGVIIVSLVAASCALPYLMRGVELPRAHPRRKEEIRARIAAAEAAILAIEQAQRELKGPEAQDPLYAEVGADLIRQYQRRIDGHAGSGKEAERIRRAAEIERELHLAAVRAERDSLYQAARAHRISDNETRRLVQEVDLVEARLLST